MITKAGFMGGLLVILSVTAIIFSAITLYYVGDALARRRIWVCAILPGSIGVVFGITFIVISALYNRPYTKLRKEWVQKIHDTIIEYRILDNASSERRVELVRTLILGSTKGKRREELVHPQNWTDRFSVPFTMKLLKEVTDLLPKKDGERTEQQKSLAKLLNEVTKAVTESYKLKRKLKSKDMKTFGPRYA